MKISLKIDLLKINKAKIKDEEYVDKDGKVVKKKIYSIDIVPLKEKKFVKDGSTWTLFKTHFGAESISKEEKESGAKSNYVAEGFTFESKEEKENPYTSPSEDYPDGINTDTMPF